jgi:hypothetical protein
MVRMMMGRSGNSLFKRVITSSPSSWGMEISITATSGGAALTMRIAPRPSAASATTVMSPLSSTIRLNPARTML